MTSDSRMPGLNVRTSTLPEELGGIQYLLTDKTGTLTQVPSNFHWRSFLTFQVNPAQSFGLLLDRRMR